MHDLASYNKRTFESIGLIILGYFGYAVADCIAKELQERYHIFQVMGMNSAVALFIITTWLVVRYGPRSMFPPNLWLHLVRAAIFSITAYLMVSALHLLPLADFYGIAFTVPFFTMIFAYFFLNERVGWHRITAAIFGFCGILVIAGPQFSHIGTGFLFALSGAVFAAMNIIALRKIGRGAPVPLYGFWPFLVIGLVCVTGLLLNSEWRPVHNEDVILILISAPFTVLGMTCIALGFTHAPDSTIVSPFHYTQIIWGILFGWLFFQTLPASTTYIGITMIICAGCYSLWREYKRKHHIPD